MEAKVARAYSMLGSEIFKTIERAAVSGHFEVEVKCKNLTEQGIASKSLRSLGFNITELNKNVLRIGW